MSGVIDIDTFPDILGDMPWFTKANGDPEEGRHPFR
jgi:hypothetical protein